MARSIGTEQLHRGRHLAGGKQWGPLGEAYRRQRELNDLYAVRRGLLADAFEQQQRSLGAGYARWMLPGVVADAGDPDGMTAGGMTARESGGAYESASHGGGFPNNVGRELMAGDGWTDWRDPGVSRGLDLYRDEHGVPTIWDGDGLPGLPPPVFDFSGNEAFWRDAIVGVGRGVRDAGAWVWNEGIPAVRSWQAQVEEDPGKAVYDLTIGSILGIPDDIETALQWGERGDGQWWKDVGDVGILAANFIPGFRQGRGVARQVDELADDASDAIQAARPMSTPADDLYDFPIHQRDFYQDHPYQRFSPDEAGRSLTPDDLDIDGFPRGEARFRVGPGVVGGPDEGLTRDQLVALATALTGRSPKPVGRDQLGGGNGGLLKGPARGPAGSGQGSVKRTDLPDDPVDEKWERQIYLADDLDQISPTMFAKVLAHENGHALTDRIGKLIVEVLARDRRSRIPFGTIPQTTTIRKELDQVYHDGNAPRRGEARVGTNPDYRWRPEDSSGVYKGRVATDAELWAEAFRAYLTNPAYMKTVAPITAKEIRRLFREHPVLSEIIRFSAVEPGFLDLDSGGDTLVA